MKKRVMWYSVLFAVFLVIAGCGEGDDNLLPPEPGAPGGISEAPSGDLAGQAYNYEQDYAPAFDVYEIEGSANAKLFNAPPTVEFTSTSATISLPITVKHLASRGAVPQSLVYKKVHVYNPKTLLWQEHTLPQTGYRGSNWICILPTDLPLASKASWPADASTYNDCVEQASTTLNLNVNDLAEGVNYIVAYTCKKQGGVWRCGMQTKDPPVGGKWMLHTFNLFNKDWAPAEPSGPGAGTACTDSDQGKTYNTQGYADFTGLPRETDSCVDANTLKEWFCDVSGTTPVRSSESKACANGCENGACKAALATFALTITKVGTGTGTVTSGDTPKTIDCGTDCTKIVNANTQVTLTATPATGSVFEGWSGDCTGTGTCSPTMTASRSTTAKFSIDAHVVCKMLLRDTVAARPTRLTDVTVDNAEAKCAALNVFGTGTTTAYSVTEADLKATSKAETLTTIENAGQADEKLVCALPCTAGRNTIIKCKDIASADSDGVEGDPDGRLFIFNPDPKCQ